VDIVSRLHLDYHTYIYIAESGHKSGYSVQIKKPPKTTFGERYDATIIPTECRDSCDVDIDANTDMMSMLGRRPL
jgi:hypothetical protein